MIYDKNKQEFNIQLSCILEEDFLFEEFNKVLITAPKYTSMKDITQEKD